MKHLLLMLLGLAASGCDTYLVEISPAPPGAVATLDDSLETIELSHGAALAFECHYNQLICIEAQVTVDDPEIAVARPAFFDELREGAYDRHTGRISSPTPASVFVIAGRQLGTTTLHIEHDDGSASYEVTVLPAP